MVAVFLKIRQQGSQRDLDSVPASYTVSAMQIHQEDLEDKRDNVNECNLMRIGNPEHSGSTAQYLVKIVKREPGAY